MENKSSGKKDIVKIILVISTSILLIINIFLLINNIELSKGYESKYDYLADRMINRYYSPENVNRAIRDTLGDKYEEKDDLHQSNSDNFDNYIFQLVINDINKYETKRKARYNDYLNAADSEDVVNFLESYEKADVNIISNNICMIKFTHFTNGETYNDLISHKDEFAKCRNYIIDLRGNMGGHLDELTDVMSMFYEKDSTVCTNVKSSGITEFKTDKDKIIDFDKLVFLCDNKTASASEIMIHSLKSDFGNKVVTVGSHTFGKNFSYAYSKFEDGEVFMYLDGIMGNSRGMTFDDSGIEPDFPADDDECIDIAEKIISGDLQ